jgi:hypothetical protein
MTTPSPGSTIGVSNVNVEIERASATNASLTFLNGYIKPAIRPGTANLYSFGGLRYYLKNNEGACNNSSVSNCNCNVPLLYDNYGNSYVDPAAIQCSKSANCTAINCANCDTQKWLQTGDCTVGTTPVYNCTSNQNCFTYNCNCSKIICTKLFDLGLMKKNIFEADQAFGDRLQKTNPDIYNGYRAWAEIVVDWMDGKGPKMMPWMSDEEFSAAAKKWSITWAHDIATPWAEEMAYLMGEKETGSLTGKMMFAFGTPICKVIGVWQRWFGPSKKEPGFLKGAGLVVIFVMFKLVAELGRLIEKTLPKKETV